MFIFRGVTIPSHAVTPPQSFQTTLPAPFGKDPGVAGDFKPRIHRKNLRKMLVNNRVFRWDMCVYLCGYIYNICMFMIICKNSIGLTVSTG